MNILAPLAAGVALTPLATKTLGQLARSLSFSNLLANPKSSAQEEDNSAAITDSTPAELTALQADITQRLRAAGVELDDSITLGMNAWGEIEVRSAHLQASEIEKLLNADRQLLEQFQHAAMLSLDERAQEANDWSAVDRFELTIP